MIITNNNITQTEQAPVLIGGGKAQATSSGSMGRTGEVRKAPVQVSKASSEASQQADIEALKEALKDLNNKMGQMNRSLQFSVDSSTREVVVKVVDTSSGEIIRQIPPDDVLKMRENFEKMAGLLIEKTV